MFPALLVNREAAQKVDGDVWISWQPRLEFDGQPPEVDRAIASV